MSCRSNPDTRHFSSTEKEDRLFTCRHHHGGIIKCSVESVFALSCTMATAWSKRRVHFTHTPSAASDNIWVFQFSVSRSSESRKRDAGTFPCVCRFSCVYTKHVGARVIQRRIDYKAERRGDSCTHTDTDRLKHRDRARANICAEPNQIGVKAETFFRQTPEIQTRFLERPT